MHHSSEAVCRSKIRFADTRQEYSGSIPFDHLRRVREPVTRSKAGLQGKLADPIHGRSRHAESENELMAFRVLVAAGRSDAWQEQPFCLEYHDEAQHRRYIPDLLVCWGGHREIVQIKSDSDAVLPDNKIRFALIGELLAEHGFHFRVWTRSEIRAEPRLSNSALVLRYRSVPVTTASYEEIRRTFSREPQIRLSRFREHPPLVHAVLRIVLEGKLHIDWWKPLSMDSTISTTPIGRQVWPLPPSHIEVERCHCMP